MKTDYQAEIAQGRACVYLIEAIDVLLLDTLDTDSIEALRRAKSIGKTKLRQLMSRLPANVSAQVLAASQKMAGMVGAISSN